MLPRRTQTPEAATMKTLYVTQMRVGTSWLVTDAEFAGEFKLSAEAITAVKALEPGKTMYFDYPGERLMDPPFSFRVLRIANPVTLTPADVLAPLLALAVFVAGVVGLVA